MFLARFRIPALLWVCLWYGVIVPLHQRGQITLPGATISTSCCANKEEGTAQGEQAVCRPATAAKGAKTSKHSEPSEEQIRACLVCYIVAVTQPAPDFHFTPPAVHELAELVPTPFLALAGVDLTPALRGRDPPRAFTPIA